MTTYYSKVNRQSGQMHDGHSNYTDNTDAPIADDELYVELNDELYKLLVSTDPEDHADLRPVDFKQTWYNFATKEWNIVYIDPGHEMLPPQQDALENQENIRQQLIGKARVYLDIPDISSKLRTKLETFVSEIEAIELTEATAPTIRWPDLPV